MIHLKERRIHLPKIYLSPSTQEANLYVNGGSEEYWMNRLADAMVPYLLSSGIQYTRNTPDMTAVSSIRASNAGNYDIHLALHSNAAPEGRYGEFQGTDVYYYPTSVNGRRLADIIAKNLKRIYPNPELVRAVSTTRLGEVRQPKVPSVLIEYAYHDNEDDANWIKNNLNEIAANTVLSLTEYFGIPFITPEPIRQGRVATRSGGLNIRSKPNTSSAVKGSIPNGATVTVYSRTGDWYVVGYRGIVGYAYADYINF